MGGQVLSDWTLILEDELDSMTLMALWGPEYLWFYITSYIAILILNTNPQKNQLSLSLLMTNQLQGETVSKIHHLQKAISKEFYVVNIDLVQLRQNEYYRL